MPQPQIARLKKGTKAMLDNPHIKAQWFAQAPGGPVKLNWFSYEVALEYYVCITQSQALASFYKRCGPKKLGKFCTHFALRIQQSVLDRLTGKEDATVIDEEYISEYLPQYSRKTHLLLQDVACIAWDRLLSVCEVCPHRCISEKEKTSPFFSGEVI